MSRVITTYEEKGRKKGRRKENQNKTSRERVKGKSSKTATDSAPRRKEEGKEQADQILFLFLFSEIAYNV
jgi:hypothetical protein